MVWKPNKTLGLVVGLIILLTIVGVDIYLVKSMVGRNVGLNLYFTALLFVLSLPLAALWAFWYYGLLTLRYYLDRNAFCIVCGTSRYVVPMETIRRVLVGSEVQPRDSFRGVGWPGYMHGTMRLVGLGTLSVQSTEPLEHQLVVVTDTLCYGISPAEPQRFLEDFSARRALGPMRQVAQTTEYTDFAAWPIWHDSSYWGLLALAFLANAVLFAVVAQVYGHLPERMALHYDSLGQVDRVGPRSNLLLVPGIGALTWVANGVLGFVLHRRERLGTYLLVAVTLAVQCVLWLAALRILNGW
jgi:hypothetical protein